MNLGFWTCHKFLFGLWTCSNLKLWILGYVSFCLISNFDLEDMKKTECWVQVEPNQLFFCSGEGFSFLRHFPGV